MQKFTSVTEEKLVFMKKIAIYQRGGESALISQFTADLHAFPKPNVGAFSIAILLVISLEVHK